jgi:sugar lactone lactonase YvrE
MQVQMKTFEPRVLSDSRDQVGECPVWSVAEQALFWVDIEGRKIHRFDWATQTQQTWSTPERVGCIALTARLGATGGVMAAMETGIFAVQLLNAPDIQVTRVANITHPAPNMRFNDGRCDARGRFWVSTMCMDMGLGSRVGAVFCLDKAGLMATPLDPLITPNGMALSPDGQTFYLSDSHPSVQKIWAFEVDPDTACISDRREFADMTDLPGRPDGAAVDVAGCYWICGNDAGLIHQFSPQGVLLRSLPVPVSKPSMCAFGGPDLDILFVTSIRPGGVSPDQPGLNGAVFALVTDTRGLPEPLFSRFPVSRI